MNYIKQLQTENAEQAAYIKGLVEGINDLRGYLHSEKFAFDIMVNKNDVLLRIKEAFCLADQYQLECKPAGLTNGQKQWASGHDWFISETEKGVLVRDDRINDNGGIDLFEVEFLNFEELKHWAGY